MADQTEIQKPRFLVGKLLIRPDHAQEVLRNGKLRLRPVQIQAVIVIIMPLDHIGVRHNHGEAGDQLNGLAHHVFHAQAVRIGITGVEGQDGAPQLVHDIVAGILENHVLRKILRQRRVGVENGGEHVVLRLRGQLAEEQKIRNLGETEALFLDIGVDQIGQIIAAIDEAALHGDAVAVDDAVAEDVADLGAADHDTGAVVIAQAALDVAVLPCLVDQGVMNFVVGA